MNESKNHFTKKQEQAYQKARLGIISTLLSGISAILFVVILILIYIPFKGDFKNYFEQKHQTKRPKKSLAFNEPDLNRIENGIHVSTGLKVSPGFELVKVNCTVCHSAKLITQNRASREGWEQMIDWMQETQGLWELGKNEARILDYLAQHYAPVKIGRRENLDLAEIEWYILDLENNE